MALALKRKGITRVRPLLGGLGAWLERQYPVERLQPPSGREIVALRQKANMSQAVFARILNVGTSTLSQWEREEKRPRGAAARLLAIVRAKGVQAILG